MVDLFVRKKVDGGAGSGNWGHTSESRKGKGRGGSDPKDVGSVSAMMPDARLRGKELKKKRIDNIHRAVKKFTARYYGKASKVAQEKIALASYLAHDYEHHVLEVADKSYEACKVMNEALKGNPHYGKIDDEALLIASLFHDTGMDGDSEDYSGDDGSKIRENHSMNSAVHVLECRAELEKMGYDADYIAVLCLGHSKSNSGLKNVDDKEEWTTVLQRIQTRCEKYKSDTGRTLVFNINDFTDGSKDENGNYIMNGQKTKSAMASIGALRLGDANRDGQEDVVMQTGKHAVYDTSRYVRATEGGWVKKEKAGVVKFSKEPWREEIDSAKVVIKGAKNGKDWELNSKLAKSPESWNEEDDRHQSEAMSKMFVIGEGNIKSLHCENNGGKITEAFILRDGYSFPECTKKCISERIEELATLSNMPRKIVINVGDCGRSERKEIAYKEYSRFVSDVKEKYGFDVEVV